MVSRAVIPVIREELNKAEKKYSETGKGKHRLALLYKEARNTYGELYNNDPTSLQAPTYKREAHKYDNLYKKFSGKFVAETADGVDEALKLPSVVDVTDVDFDSFVGGRYLKKEFEKKVIYPLMFPKLAKECKVQVGGGVLLYGPYGCGKTYLARCAAGECRKQLEGKVYFRALTVSEWMSKWRGEGPKLIRETFKQASDDAKKGASILFIDELDSLFASRSLSDSSGADAKTINELAAQMAGFRGKENVLVMGATNHPWAIDPVFWRRFDSKLFIPPPEAGAREGLFKKYALNKNLDFKRLAKMSDGFSCDDIEKICAKASVGRFTTIVEQRLGLKYDKSFKYNTNLLVSLVSEWKSTAAPWWVEAKHVLSTDEKAKEHFGVVEQYISKFLGKGLEQRIHLPNARNQRYSWIQLEKDRNPFVLSGVARQVAEEVVSQAGSLDERGRALFEYVKKQVAPSATAAEVGRNVGLFVALARQAGLTSGYVRVNVDETGRKVNHACAYVDFNGLELLIDPIYGFGVQHKDYRRLSDDAALNYYGVILGPGKKQKGKKEEPRRIK